MKFAVLPAWLLSALAVAVACSSASPVPDSATPPVVDAKAVARGEQLAAVGNCRGCHTRRDGPAYAGGVPLHSPFGTIHSTNITPDRETGIGGYSLEAFRRAMREGIRNDGAHLYPAFPYDRFTRTSDEDIGAIYAYLTTLTPVRYEPPKNTLVFPFNVRAGIALWKRMHMPRDIPTPASRGEYLVESLGHCGSCHSPRTKTFGEDRKRAYDGGDTEGWHAYAINEKNNAPIPWDAAALAFYLRNGFHSQHGIARGTMGIVTHDLAQAAPEDVDAMAAYVTGLMKAPSAERIARGQRLLKEPNVAQPSKEEGAKIYEETCRGCHGGRRELPWNGLPLSMSMGIAGESPRNLINVILHGIAPPPNGNTGPTMPGYNGAYSEAQIEALAKWLRAEVAREPPWPHDLRKLITESKAMTPDMLLFPPGGTGADPAARSR